MTAKHPFTHAPSRRGSIAVTLVVALIVLQLVVVGMVLAGSREQDLTARRLETMRAFYAAEAGMNMAVRELMNNADEDGDGVIGSISDDANTADDPALAGAAKVHVTLDDGGTTITVTAEGSAGQARRRVEATLE